MLTASEFLIATLEAEKQWRNALKEYCFQARILPPAKLLIKGKNRIKTFHTSEVLKYYVHVLFLRKLLKDMFHSKKGVNHSGYRKQRRYSTGIPGTRAVHLQRGPLGLTGASQKAPLVEDLR